MNAFTFSSLICIFMLLIIQVILFHLQLLSYIFWKIMIECQMFFTFVIIKPSFVAKSEIWNNNRQFKSCKKLDR